MNKTVKNLLIESIFFSLATLFFVNKLVIQEASASTCIGQRAYDKCTSGYCCAFDIYDVPTGCIRKGTDTPDPLDDFCVQEYNNGDGSGEEVYCGSDCSWSKNVTFCDGIKLATSVPLTYYCAEHNETVAGGCCLGGSGGDTTPGNDITYGSLKGYVWSDDDGDNTADQNEFWVEPSYSYLPCANSDKIFNFMVDVHRPPNNVIPEEEIDYWTCDSSKKVYPFTVPMWSTADNTFSKTPYDHPLRLINSPTSVDSWKYISYINIVDKYSTNGSGSWTGIDTILLYSEDDNFLSFKMYGAKECQVNNTFDLQINTYVVGGSTNTCNTGVFAPNGIKVKPCNTDSTSCLSWKSISSGSALWKDVSVATYGGSVKVTASGTSTSGGVTDVYTLGCPINGIKTVSATSCVTKTINIGVKVSDKDSWITSIDSDIFADSIDVSVPLATELNNGFGTYLVNSKDNDIGGYVFSQSGITTATSRLYETSLGGKAMNLGDDPSHESKWLDNFEFVPPNSAVTKVITTVPTTIASGTVYQISASNFKSWMSGLTATFTYRIKDGVAVMYIVGDEDITINKTIVSSTVAGSTTKGRLVIVSQPKVIISSSVGFTDITNYKITSVPKVDASIISRSGIEFGTVSSGTDIPVMVLGPLVSRDFIDFNRNLSDYYNARLPAESVLYYGKYLYEIASLEREKSQDYLYYTGLSTYDIDFDYIY